MYRAQNGIIFRMNDVPAVELRQVSKLFGGGVKAVDQLTLQIPAGQVVALLGPSGCGKTTTLRLINRLEEATSGTVLVRGQEVRSQRPEVLRRSIGYVIQEGGLFPHRDLAANVATVPRLLGWDRQRVRKRVAEVLDLVGLPQAQFGRRMPSELSGGQRQRVGVARALAADPDLLLMDEPFGALDPGTREAIHDEFLRLQAQLRKTVVLVTHDIVEAGRLAQQIVLLDHGQVVQRGSLRDLLLRPADDRARAFLGSRAQELALGVLQLGQVLEGLPADKAAGQLLHLPAQLPLGQALVALAGCGDAAAVAIDGDSAGIYSAGALKSRILSDLETARTSHAGNRLS
jgi:osmoprotectant transport system ATP-binding protein